MTECLSYDKRIDCHALDFVKTQNLMRGNDDCGVDCHALEYVFKNRF
ncbi:hypothetical protein [Helicobacter sp. T3_23-1056]